MTYNEYVEKVTTIFRRFISLTDVEFEEYFAREETIAFIKEGYEYFTGNCKLHAAGSGLYTGPAVLI